MLKNSFLILIISAITLFAQDVIETKQNGLINWSEGTATSTGLGFAKKGYNKTIIIQKAKRAAKLDAMRNLLEIIGSIRIDSSSTISDKILEDDSVKTKINGYIRNIINIKYTELEDNTVQAEITIKLDSEIYPNFKQNDDLLLDTKMFTGKKATGIIINAKNVNFVPSLSPKIIQEFKGTLYPANIVKKDNISNKFVVTYLRNLNDAKRHELVGEFPIIINAKKVNGLKNDQLVLDKANSSKIKNEVKLKALEEARVIIVIK